MSDHDMGLVIIESEEELKVPCHSKIISTQFELIEYLVDLIKRENSNSNPNRYRIT
jgi:hypothetical protein